MDHRIESRISLLMSIVGLIIIVLVVLGCRVIHREESSNPTNSYASYDTFIDTSKDQLPSEDDRQNSARIIARPKRISHDATRSARHHSSKKSKRNETFSDSRLAPQFLNPIELQTEVISMSDGNVSSSKTIVRTANRILIRPTHSSSTVEWLFVQNPVSPHQINGFKIDHRHQVILEYDDNTLRHNGIAYGWAQVANLGVDPTQFQHLYKTKKRRSFASIQFHQYRTSVASKHSSSAYLRELWWNEELALPLQWEVQNHDEITRVKLVNLNLKPSIDHERLIDPQKRFPRYTVMDATDWLEQLHDHSNHSESAKTIKR